MEMDCNPMDLSNNTGVEDNSEFKDFEGTDVKDMRLEAEAVVNDVLFAVSNMFVSKSLPCAEDVAYINVETRERNRYCLELTEAGLRVILPFVKISYKSNVSQRLFSNLLYHKSSPLQFLFFVPSVSECLFLYGRC